VAPPYGPLAVCSEDPGRSVCLIEAGPDHRPYTDGRWPGDLLNAHELAVSHDWGIEGGWPSWRAKVLGGCSAHNGCNIVKDHRPTTTTGPATPGLCGRAGNASSSATPSMFNLCR
jgi:hypothetical protein